MHKSTIIAGLFAAVAYATPIASEGRWSPDWQKQRDAASASVSVVASSAASSAAVVAATPHLLGNPNAAPNPGPNAELSASLLTAASASARMTLLKNAADKNLTDFKFDFNPAANPGITPGQGGQVVLANRANFPALTGLGTAFAGLFFAPCGLNTPHIHPRATEVLTLVTEGTLTGGFVFDNAFTMEISENLTQFQGMAFPMGSIHWQLNNECTPQVAIAGFSHEDPGASSIAQNFIKNTKGDIVLASLGFPSQITPDNFKAFKDNIPAPFVLGIQDCYARCGIHT